MTNLIKEFVKRTRASIRNEQLNEYDGRLVEDNKEWLSKELTI
jgi:hypothetical protein